MKRLLTLILILGMINALQAQGIIFEEGLSWSQVLGKAKKENKLIFLDAYATWCVPCKWLDQNVYPKKEAGDAFNKNFISVKVQMDRTSKDNDFVKSWYVVAKQIGDEFNVNSFPMLLFFSPEGKLLFKKAGIANATALAGLAKNVLDPTESFEHKILLYAKKKMDIRDYPAFADQAFALGKEEFARDLRLEYKVEYLDTLSMGRLLTRENLNFLLKNWIILDSSDRFYLKCQDDPQSVDSTIKAQDVQVGNRYPKTAADLVQRIIVQERISNQLIDRKGNAVLNPDWDRIKTGFLKAYTSDDALKIFHQQKVFFFENIRDWGRFVDAVDELLTECPAIKSDLGFLVYGLNNYAWYAIFLNCPDSQLLARASRWMDLAIARVPEDFGLVDTKANLLYKSGKKDEAIVLEQSIVEKLVKQTGKPAPDAGGEFYETLQKMKKGEKTW